MRASSAFNYRHFIQSRTRFLEVAQVIFGSALNQIVPEQALVIGDFGMGSDSPIILDFAANQSNPPVLRLRWHSECQYTEWAQGAKDFDDFANMLGLTDGVA
jgi:hypothetical protein